MGSYSSFSDFPLYSAIGNIVPSNVGRGEKAKKLVESYAKSAVLQFEEALITQGIPICVFNKIPTERFCTCTPDEKDPDSQAVFNTSPKQSKEEKIGKVKEKVSGFINSLDTGEIPIDNFKDNNFFEGQNIKDPTNEVDEAYRMQGAILNGFSSKGNNVSCINSISCPICLGSFRSDSYQLMNGKRLVLCGDGYYECTFKDAILNKNKRPHEFYLDGYGSVFFNITLPSYFDVLKIQCYYGRNKAQNIALRFKEEGQDAYEELTKETLQKRQGKKNKIIIQARNKSSNVNAFTHIEIVLSFNTSDIAINRMAMGRLQMPEDSKYAELFGSADVVLSPRLKDYLSRETIICDAKYGYTWAVGEINKNYTAQGYLFQLNTTLRMCQRGEIYNLLNVYEEKLNRKGRFLK